MKDKVDCFVTVIVLSAIAITMTGMSIVLAIELKGSDNKIKDQNELITELKNENTLPFIHIDDDSGFLSSDSVMASYQQFNSDSGASVWVRVERSGFEQAHEFSVGTVQEAEIILRGLVE